MNSPSPSEVLSLYRNILRYGRQLKLTDREFFEIRVRSEFKKGKDLQNADDKKFHYEGPCPVKKQASGVKIMALNLGFKKCLQEYFRKYGALARKHTIDRSKVPLILEEDLEENFVKGSGPGGQAVNKTNNCVVLTHKPTGIVVRCHKSRLQEENRREARHLLTVHLDALVNGENSIEAQKQREAARKSAELKRRQRRLYELKRKWKERENVE